MTKDIKLQVYEIFNSISGEVGLIPQGAPATFIRFAGCNLKCVWCDTAVTQSKNIGSSMTVQDVLDQVQDIGCPNIVITGGEPMLQVEGLELLTRALISKGYTVQIETNGSMLLPRHWRPHCWVVDYKLPSSGYEGVSIEPFYHTPNNSFIKFICADKKDFEKAVDIKNRIHKRHKESRINGGIHYAFSAVEPLSHTDLLRWIQEKGLWEIIINVQIHKAIGAA